MSDAPSRQLLHTREVVCSGYLRSDGLFDIEARLLDTKAERFELPFRTFGAGEPLHQMRLRLTVDRTLVIRECEAVTEAAPTPWCHEINSAYAALVGLRIGPGFKKRALAVIGGVRGCTHLTELLGPLATTAFQAVGSVLMADAQKPGDISPRQWVVDGCHAYRADGEVARRLLAAEAERAGTTPTDTGGSAESESAPHGGGDCPREPRNH
ncbi:hypothetical protein FQZ97_766960 [compost metagenome]